MKRKKKVHFSFKPGHRLFGLSVFKIFIIYTLLALYFNPHLNWAAPDNTFPLPRDVLLDKIKGGWAGQAIGCTFGGPTEFRFQSTFIPDYTPLLWSPQQLRWTFENVPALYDDLYADFVFVEALEKNGLNASTEVLTRALARGQFLLHHGLQMARHNFLVGLKPPQTGHWLNNPHADDNDFQRVADFIGLMSPGMVTPAVKVGDKIGHIISYGDGWYAGIYVATLYSLAFTSENIERMIEEAWRLIPLRSTFSQVISDVIQAYRQNPSDWKETWFKIEKTWGEDIGCPEGIFSPFNIDAKINAAWVTLGLLYGRGDFGRTLSLTVRCGDDTDSNAATAGGILGALLGYSKIPPGWKQGMNEVESMKYSPVGLSLEDATRLSFKHALEMIRRNGGRSDGDPVIIPFQKPPSLPYEVSFENHFPKERRFLNIRLTETKSEVTIEFEGIGFAINGGIVKKGGEDHIYRVAMVIDGRFAGVSVLPSHPFLRNVTPFFRYNLRQGKHRLFLEISEPSPKADLQLDDIIIYDSKRPHVEY